MKSTLILWKEIIGNPFSGYKKLGDDTKLFLPFLIIVILFLLSLAMMIPMQSSDVYSDALVRIQQAAMSERGTEMSAEQVEAMSRQMRSPMVRNITTASTFVIGLISYIGITLLIALFLKLISGGLRKESVKYSLVLKIMLFAAIVTMVQSLVKMGITVTGDWQRALARVNTSTDLQFALQSPISLAAFFDPASMGRQVFYIVDYLTDIFNWIYYIFLYAGLRSSLAMDKGKALTATVLIAVISIVVSLLFTLVG